ncbi:hypothetical protein E4U41_000401 [Claviceps citrina]|nr:hypothetical protein E4U41_000401 [Claviceps citrina]
MATVVVKLGGAAITDKTKADTLAPSLDALVDKIARVYQTELRPHGRRLVLIHGAGSFGHPPAKKFQVKAGWSTTGTDEQGGSVLAHGETEHVDRVKFGMAFTRQRVLQLHHHVLQKLQDRGRLPVLSVSTYDTVETCRGQLTPDSSTRLVTRVQSLLAQGFIPLLFGDAVLDRAWGSTILSGDALMHTLATELLQVQRCVFVTDVAGIYTRDPKLFDDATLVHRLRCSTDRGIEGGDASTSVDDVTGAMGSKWQWVKRIMACAPHVREVIICQASDSQEAVSLAVDGLVDTRSWTTIVR